MPHANRFRGLWQRLLLSLPNRPVDTLTRVDWLQGDSFFVDLRQPPDLAGMVTAGCLAELSLTEALALAGQEAFAGRFVLSGDEAEWQRGIDFRPCPLGDRGRLEQHGELTIEHGIEAAYIEYWQREPHTASGASGSALFRSENDGRIAILVRQGNRFGYARDRQCPLGRHEELTELLRDASPESARNLVDCEVSMGTVTAQGWRIERSTLPWRQGARLIDSNTHIGEDRLIVRDADAEGAPLPRALRLLESYGSLDDDAMASPAAPPRTGLAQPVPVIDIAALAAAMGMRKLRSSANWGARQATPDSSMSPVTASRPT